MIVDYWKKSNAVCTNEAKKQRSWHFSGCEIVEVEEYKHLGVTVKAGLKWETEWWM